jgi:hypothetical protein
MFDIGKIGVCSFRRLGYRFLYISLVYSACPFGTFRLYSTVTDGRHLNNTKGMSFLAAGTISMTLTNQGH